MAYLSIADLRLIGGEIIEKFPDEQLLYHAGMYEHEANVYWLARFGSGTQLPTVEDTVPTAEKMYIARAVVRSLLLSRGYSPQGDDDVIEKYYADFLAYFKGVTEDGESTDPGGGADGAAGPVRAPEVFSDCPREPSRWDSRVDCCNYYDDW